jgi:hypothetical protein
MAGSRGKVGSAGALRPLRLELTEIPLSPLRLFLDIEAAGG